MKKEKSIKILVAAHKPYGMPKDNIYVPLQVGAKGRENMGFLRDDTGKNISSKNPNYCELTGMYWAWKNLNCDIVGLMHYRRYLSLHDISEIKDARTDDEKYKLILNSNEIKELLRRYDVLVPMTKLYTKTVYTKYAQQHYIKDLDNARELIKEDYPEMLDAFDKVMDNKEYAIGNMCVMRKKLFDEYCKWLFGLFSKLEKNTDMSGYSVLQQRMYGFLSERLFNVWIEYKELKVKKLNLVALEHDNLSQLWHKVWHRVLHIKL